MVEDLDAGVRRRWPVGDHDVDLEGRHPGQQAVGVVLDAQQVRRIAAMQDRLQQPVHDQLRHRIGDADREARARLGGASAQRLDHLAADWKDVVGILVDDAPGIGEAQAAAVPLEQRDFERAFELADLRGHGRLREAQPLSGPGDAAFADDGPEGTAGGGS